MFSIETTLTADGDIMIKILFKDSKDDGVTKTDNPRSCIVPAYSRYSLNFAAKTSSFTPNITSTYDNETEYRKWTYTIPANTFNTVLFYSESSNSTHLIYVSY